MALRIPSDGELEILRVLWDVAPATVRQVHDRLPRSGEVGYNTVGKLLQIMEEKGLVARDGTARAHTFRPLVKKGETERTLIRDLADRVFDGSAAALALRALGAGALSESEVAELRQILDHLDRS